jgi:uncharacterized protein (DUF2141 family)
MRIFILIMTILLSYNAYSQEVDVQFEINNLRNTDGGIIVNVFKDQQGFDDDIPILRKAISKKENMVSGIFTAKINLPPGTYGIAFFDDENDSGDMDFNFIGMPKEGYGFSEFYHTGITTPKFFDFSFKLTKNTSIMKIRLRYM